MSTTEWISLTQSFQSISAEKASQQQVQRIWQLSKAVTGVAKTALSLRSQTVGTKNGGENGIKLLRCTAFAF